MSTAWQVLPFWMLVTLAGCAAPPPAVEASTASSEAPPAPVQDAQQSLPPDFTLSLVDPARTVRVQGNDVRLVDADGERRFTLERNEVLFDGRLVMASDARGTLELRITQRLCQPPGGAEPLPYTGRLTLDGGEPALGCGAPLVASP